MGGDLTFKLNNVIKLKLESLRLVKSTHNDE